MRKVRIVSTGVDFPERIVTSDELDLRLSLPKGWALQKSGAKIRRHVTTETSSQMGARAAKKALDAASLKINDLDLLICASGTSEQEIPCTAALIQRELGAGASGLPSFDINSTCLSFIVATDIVASLIDSKRYRRVLVVSTEASSTAINWNEKESAVLIGDGAAAVVFESADEDSDCGVLTAKIETYGDHLDAVEFKGGGTKIMGTPNAQLSDPKFQFQMDGPSVFKLASKIVPGFLKRAMAPIHFSLSDLQLIIPHQASIVALELMKRRLEIPEQKFFMNIAEHGNMVAASIPAALHEAIQQHRLKRGDHCLLVGTSAGFSVGAMVLKY